MVALPPRGQLSDYLKDKFPEWQAIERRKGKTIPNEFTSWLQVSKAPFTELVARFPEVARQIEDYEKQLDRKNSELAKGRAREHDLMRQLAEAKAETVAVRDELMDEIAKGMPVEVRSVFGEARSFCGVCRNCAADSLRLPSPEVNVRNQIIYVTWHLFTTIKRGQAVSMFS